ncbi:uncharacterized protein DS421_1g10920 [Arachis hypogaea]|nr:uncharacterized protein DS421_1g10920 [Arachis hypogaea]
MHPPSRRRSSTCPTTTTIASAPPQCVLLQRHPNASVLSCVLSLHLAAISSLFILSSAAMHPSIQPSPSSMKTSAPSPSSVDFQNM